MPLIEIEVIGELVVPENSLAKKLADELGRLLGSASGGTWVRLRSLPPSQYAENGVDDPLGAEAIFVKVTHRILPASETLAVEAKAISVVVASTCQRQAEQVHVIYEPSGQGRIAFGGKLIT
jgi:phenylpyruvate tautomerase PptA (4-oxalocrotonate tautomerase family)